MLSLSDFQQNEDGSYIYRKTSLLGECIVDIFNKYPQPEGTEISIRRPDQFSLSVKLLRDNANPYTDKERRTLESYISDVLNEFNTLTASYRKIRSLMTDRFDDGPHIWTEEDVEATSNYLKNTGFRLDVYNSKDDRYVLMPESIAVTFRELDNYIDGSRSGVNHDACIKALETLRDHSSLLNDIEDVRNALRDEIERCRSQRNRFENSFNIFTADNETYYNIFSHIDGLVSEKTGNSGFASRNHYRFHAVTPEKAYFPTDAEIEKQTEISRLCEEWADKQIEHIKTERFVKAFNTNLHGAVSIVAEGGNNPSMRVPESYMKILEVKTANTRDHRLHLDHTYDSLYIKKESLTPDKNGNLHLDIPKEYMGMFIGKGGAHIREVTDSLHKVDPRITNIKCHEYNFTREKVPVVLYDDIAKRTSVSELMASSPFFSLQHTPMSEQFIEDTMLSESSDISISQNLRKENTIMNSKIYLAGTQQLAEQVKATATVEAEYGEACVEGTLVTLAHHGPRSNNPAPCNAPDVPVLPDGSTILVSHIDLDTLGGIMALNGEKPDDPAFWAAAEFVDINGAHKINTREFDNVILEAGGDINTSERVKDQLNAFYAWSEQNRSPRSNTEVLDISTYTYQAINVLKELVVDRNAQNHELSDLKSRLIHDGHVWEEQNRENAKKYLVTENEMVRVFQTDGPFMNTNYFSEKQNTVVPCIISFNTQTKAITLSFEDGGKTMNAAKELQELFGPAAGGREGIGGSPRGQEMTLDDAMRLAEQVQTHMVLNGHEKVDVSFAIGVMPGYAGHTDITPEVAAQSVLSRLQEEGITDAKVTPATAVYLQDWGCPDGGEPVAYVNLSIPPQEIDSLRITISSMMADLKQSTVTVEYSPVVNDVTLEKTRICDYIVNKYSSDERSIDTLEDVEISRYVSQGKEFTFQTNNRSDIDAVKLGTYIQDLEKAYMDKGEYIPTGILVRNDSQTVTYEGSSNPVFGQNPNHYSQVFDNFTKEITDNTDLVVVKEDTTKSVFLSQQDAAQPEKESVEISEHNITDDDEPAL